MKAELFLPLNLRTRQKMLPMATTSEMQPDKGSLDTTDRAATAKSLTHLEGQFRTGNDADVWDMKRMGRSQELRRNFKSLSVLGLAVTTMSTWMGLLFGNIFSLTNGGLAGTIWVYFTTWTFTFALAASLAEMASMAPTSGGQYRELSLVFVRHSDNMTNLISGQTGSQSLLQHHTRASCRTSLAGWPR